MALLWLLLVFFFFQAEDGIRDYKVTGVQTCALPICAGLGQTTWPPDGWKHGGAPVWGWLSYDPALDLFYYGTGNPAPYNADQRPGDNKWATSVLARRPGDGTLVWAYQFTPADNWDYDAVQEMILRSEEHTSELQSPCNLVCRLLLEKKKLSIFLRA